MATPFAGRALPTQDEAWLASMARRLHREQQLAHLDEDPTSALLVPNSQHPARLVPLAYNETHEPLDLVWDGPAQLDQLARCLAAQKRPALLPRVPDDSPTIAALRKAFTGRGWVIVRPAPGTPTIALDASWAESQMKFNAGHRSDFRRAERHAAKLGELSFEIHTQPSEQALDQLLDEAFDVEAHNWKGDAGTALLHDQALGSFFRHYAHGARREGILRLAFMRIGGQAVGMQLAVEWQQSWWLLKIGYDSRFARCSPGTLLMLHTVADAARRGLRSYEFLGNPAPWTDMWTQTLKPHVDVRLYPFSVAGQVALLQDISTMVQARVKATLQSGRIQSTVKRHLLTPVKRLVSAMAAPVLNLASRAYVPGPRLEDAVRMARRVEADGMAVTIGYFNADSDSPDLIEDQGRAAVDAAARLNKPAYVSVKVPPLAYALHRTREIASRAARHHQLLHFDSHGPDTAQPTLQLLDALRSQQAPLSLTVPGRWRRSLQDCDWAVQRGIRVRVVKGQWACPLEPDMDLRSGFLAVIDRLAGRATEVAVATHDAPLAREALRRLQQAGTPCELELLCGLPRREVMAVARELNVPVRFYIPYGTAWLPYALGQLVRKPQLWGWMLRDVANKLLHR